MIARTLIIALFCAAGLLHATQARAQVFVWEQVRKGYYAMSAIACLDSANCIAPMNQVGKATFILKTTDGGHSWNIINTRSVDSGYPFIGLFNTAYPASGVILITADSGIVFRSTDGGYNWSRTDVAPVKALTGTSKPLISMCDPLHGILSIYPYTDSVFVTRDGGLSWQVSRTNIPQRWQTWSIYLAVAISPSNFICITSDSLAHALGRSVDGGRSWTWTEMPHMQDTAIMWIGFVDSLYGWIRQDLQRSPYQRMRLLQTTNGGDTWNVVYNDSVLAGSEVLTGICFSDRNNGIVSGFYHVSRTTDAGRTWHKDSLPSGLVGGSPIMKPGNNGIIHTLSHDILLCRPLTSGVPAGPDAAHQPTLAVYPNILPQGNRTDIRFSITMPSRAQIQIVDILGRVVQTIHTDILPPGLHWHKINTEQLPAGTYRVRLTADQATATAALHILR